MTKEQQEEIVGLMQGVFGPSVEKIHYRTNNFWIVEKRDANGVLCRMVLKEKNPWVVLYGGDYKKKRDFIRCHKDEFISAIPNCLIEIDDNDDIRGNDAVWCRVKLSGVDRNWFGKGSMVIDVAKKVYDKISEWGLLLNNAATRDVSNKKESAPSSEAIKNCSEGKNAGGVKLPKQKKTSEAELKWNGWDEYYEFWDGFVRNWFESRANPDDDISNLYKEIFTDRDQFNIDELPEPYQGDPASGVEAVVLNLNPGMSQRGHYGAFEGRNLESTKCYSNIDNRNDGWLIRKFRDESQGSYRNFIREWACLNPTLRGHEPEVCGVDWWQGDNPNCVAGRMKWVRQIYGNEELSPSKVFATEICPFHSKAFSTDNLGKLISFIKDRVIVPTVMAVVENKLPFAVAVGRSYANVLDVLGTLKKEWDYRSPMTDWPRVGFWQRTYRLYSIDISSGKSAYILVTWARAYGLPAPGNEFAAVERRIRDYVNREALC